MVVCNPHHCEIRTYNNNNNKNFLKGRHSFVTKNPKEPNTFRQFYPIKYFVPVVLKPSIVNAAIRIRVCAFAAISIVCLATQHPTFTESVWVVYNGHTDASRSGDKI